MSMELSNQKKLSEFYEELKRMKIKIIRPDINKCYADFSAENDNFYYALGAIKNVGYESVSNIVKERLKNGIYKNIFDFINRIDPKDINKLQLEGLVRAGAFDSLNNNRNSIFQAIPSLILKSKNLHESKKVNQINLFDEDSEQTDKELIPKMQDFKFEDRLSKEFETLGFYISDHPLNQFNSIFKQFNVISFDEFENNTNILSSNVACTVLKVQEKKTQKGNSYAIIKFSDLSSVFELFIFSDIFEVNREIIKEGNSLMLTLMKNYIDENKNQKRINVKKIILLKDIIDKPIKNITFKFKNIVDLKGLKKLSKKDAETVVKVLLEEKERTILFQLKDKRKVTNRLLNITNLDKNVLVQ